MFLNPRTRGFIDLYETKFHSLRCLILPRIILILTHNGIMQQRVPEVNCPLQKGKKKNKTPKPPSKMLLINLLLVSLPLHLLHSILLFLVTSSDAPSRRGTERSELLLCKRRATQRFQNWLYARKISSRERRAQSTQHYTQGDPPCREELLPSISRVEMHPCFPV